MQYSTLTIKEENRFKRNRFKRKVEILEARADRMDELEATVRQVKQTALHILVQYSFFNSIIRTNNCV
jgi:hypothetical protein